MNRSRLLALALAATLGAGAAAQAQPTPAPQPAAMADASTGHGWDTGRMHHRMEADHAQHIKALHEALNIRPDQEAAFSAFAAAMRPDAHDDWRKHDQMDQGAMQAMTTPQRLDHMAQMMDERTAHMREAFQRRASATKALYAVLSPDQRHTMDALHDLTGHGRRHGDWGHGHRHGHGPMDHGHGDKTATAQ